jgi:REP element-mobilizing transposase RayT
MARPLRIEFAGALYHVTARGNERRDIFFSDDDRSRFLDTLGKVCARFDWRCHAFCQMTNHYHLLVETAQANLSRGMRQLNGVYSQQVNHRYRRVGHLFQGRFSGILVQKENYLLELSRYIVLNPVRARMVAASEDWLWSSYRATVGLAPKPAFLTTDWLLSAFGKERVAAREAFACFVADGHGRPSPWAQLKSQIYLGSEEFVERMQRRIDAEQPLEEIPARQKRPVPRPLAHYTERYASRDRAMAEAFRSGAYSMGQIAAHFGVGRMTVSRAVKRFEALLKEEK